MVEVRRTQISEAQCVSSLQGERNEAIQNSSRSGELRCALWPGPRSLDLSGTVTFIFGRF
jgi:hypothetical protein